MKMNVSKIMMVLIVVLMALSSATWAAPSWTLVQDAADLEDFFVDSGIWDDLLPAEAIPVASIPAESLSAGLVLRAREYISSTIPEEVMVPTEDSHLSTAGDLYVNEKFTVYLLTQECANWDEVGYFTYQIDEEGRLYIGEAGVIYPLVNKTSGPELGTGAEVVLQQEYDGFVRVGFFIRNTRSISWSYYASHPLSQTIFTVSEFNSIPGKEWYNDRGEPSLYSNPPARTEFSYIFDEEAVRDLFPASDRPVLVGFEDDFWSNYADGWPSDWDYNDVVLMTDPMFRSAETNAPLSGSVSGLVWVDDDQDGVRDEEEVTLDSVTVNLLDADGEIVESTTTDVNGQYRFVGLDSGVYYVSFVTDADWTLSPMWQGGDATVDSDAFPATGITEAIELAAGEEYEHVDLGVYGAWVDDLCEMLGLATNFNALIFGDLTSTGGDTEGRLAVGGTARLNIAGYSVGYATVGRPIPILGATADMLIVGGDLYDGYFGVNGNIVYGGARYGGYRDFPDGNGMRQVVPITFDASGNVKDDGTGYTFDYLRERMEVRSALYADKFERGVVGKETPDEWHFVLVGNDPALNVFHVNAEEWNGTGREIKISAPSGSTVLINITGEDIFLRNGQITLVGVDYENVLYNYANATNITVQSFDHEGSVLAPYADLSMSGAAVNGHAVIGGNVNNVVGSEFHNIHFRGELCVDEPTVADLPGVAFVMTMNNEASGRILTTQAGSAVTNHYRVINTGVTYLGDILIEDETLGTVARIQTGTAPLAPGGSTNVSVVVPHVTSSTVFRATAKASPVGAHGETSVWAPLQAQDSAALVIGTPRDPDAPNPEWYRADFAVEAIRFDGEAPVMTGEVFSVVVTVVNNGNLKGDAGILSLYLNAPEMVAGAQDDCHLEVGELEVGESRTYTFPSLSVDTHNTYHIRAFVESAERTEEWSEGDNQATLVQTIRDQRPDFAVTAIRFVEEPTLTEQAFSVVVTVVNNGEIAGDAGLLSVYVSQPTYAATGQTGEASIEVGTLAVGESRELTLDGLVTPAVRATHHLRAFVDSEGQATEWSKGDNQLSLVYAASLPTLQSPTAPADEEAEYSLIWNGFESDSYSVEASTDLLAPNAGFQVVVSGIVLGGSSPFYHTEGNTIYFKDPNQYEGTVVYRVAIHEKAALYGE